ncbi:MAG: VOC family protein [Pseudomonadota bacterium]
MSILAYSMVGTNNFERARKFYGELLSDLNAIETFVRPDGGVVMWGRKPGEAFFAIAKPADGGTATVGNGVMVAFAARDPAQVKALYDKAISLGASCAGEPGPRLTGSVSCAYVRDLDGNKLNFFCMGS